MRAVRLSSLVSLMLGILLYLASFLFNDSPAYVFPRILALTFSFLAIVLILNDLTSAGMQEKKNWDWTVWHKLWPVLLVIILYLLLAEQLGFYVSSFLVFVALGMHYAPKKNHIASFKRCIAIALIFLCALYLLFTQLLRVQLPRGLFF